jgi:hypothetical protein
MMGCKARIAFFICLSPLIICLPPLSNASSRKSDELLKNIKNIYVQFNENGKTDARRTGFAALLYREVSRKGFMASNDLAGADAILSGSVGDGVVVDGEPFDPPRYGYQCRLESKAGESLWRTEFNLRSRIGAEDADQKAAVRIVEGIDKAIKAAIKRTKKNQ